MDPALGTVLGCENTFRKLVGECVGNIRVRLSLGCLHMSHPLQKYLADHSDQEVAAGIALATRPAVQQLFCQQEFAKDE